MTTLLALQHKYGDWKFIGNKDVYEQVRMCFIFGEPFILQGEPGTGKTTLIKNMVKEFEIEDREIYITAGNDDASVADIFGPSVKKLMSEGKVEVSDAFKDIKVVFIDEFNRLNEKVMNELGEAMRIGEFRMPFGGENYIVKIPPIIVAQNPFGTIGVRKVPQHIKSRQIKVIDILVRDDVDDNSVVQEHLDILKSNIWRRVKEQVEDKEVVERADKIGVELDWEHINKIEIPEELFYYIIYTWLLIRNDERTHDRNRPTIRGYINTALSAIYDAILKGKKSLTKKDIRTHIFTSMIGQFELTPTARTSSKKKVIHDAMRKAEPYANKHEEYVSTKKEFKDIEKIETDISFPIVVQKYLRASSSNVKVFNSVVDSYLSMYDEYLDNISDIKVISMPLEPVMKVVHDEKVKNFRLEKKSIARLQDIYIRIIDSSNKASSEIMKAKVVKEITAHKSLIGDIVPTIMSIIGSSDASR